MQLLIKIKKTDRKSNMKKLLLLTSLICFFYTTETSAGIRFIMDTNAGIKDSNKTNDSYQSDTENYDAVNTDSCLAEGYNKTSCEAGFFPADPCPYNSGYYANCCPEEYKYTKQDCISQNKTFSTFSCGGYYKCND